ncbi:hypothetical protein D9M69_689260 [compost metagenome]
MGAIAWALQRWGVSQVSVDGYAGNDAALALARAESVATLLDKQGVHGATARAVPGGVARSVATAEGSTVLREARIRLDTP